MQWARVAILSSLACLAGSGGSARSEPPRETPADAPREIRRPQLAAAASDAREALRQDILAVRLLPDLTAGEFLTRAGGAGELVTTLLDAQQRGGTRWTNDQTCEIRLEIPGAQVAAALGRVAAASGARAGVAPDALQKAIDSLKGQTFSALGKSTGGANLMRLRPDALNEAWRDVSDQDRLDAVLAARSNAVARVVESLRPLPLGKDKTLDDALNVPGVADEVRQWVAGRPITSAEFGDNREVKLTLSAPPEELWPVLRSALLRANQGPPPDDARAWDQVRDDVLRGTAPAVGRSTAAAPKPPTTRSAAIPPQPPRWVAGQLDADGVAHGGGLKTARAAEVAALGRLRAQIDGLPLNEGTTLGEAAKIDPRIERALQEVLRRAPTTKVDYQERGTVHVRVSLDLEDLWRALRVLR